MKTSRFLLNLSIIITITFSIVACSNQNVQKSLLDKSFQDDLGRTLSLPNSINKIAVDTASIGEILIGLGYSDNVVAINDTIAGSKLGPLTAISDSPIFTSGEDPYSGINFELLLEVNPDVYFTMANPENREALEVVAKKLPGVTIIALNVNDLKGYISTIQTLGKLFGISDSENKYLAFFENCNEILESHEKNITNTVKVYYEIAPYFTFSNKTPGIGSQIPAAYGINIAGESSAEWFDVSSEFVMSQNPDVIVVPTWNFGDGASGFGVKDTSIVQKGLENIASRPELASVNAIKNGRLLALDSEIISTPRSIIGILYMAKYFYPKEFTDVDVEALHIHYLQDFFGINSIDGLFEYEYRPQN